MEVRSGHLASLVTLLSIIGSITVSADNGNIVVLSIEANLKDGL